MSTKKTLSSMALMAVCGCLGGVTEASQSPQQQQEVRDSEPTKTKTGFYCNTKALSPAERARHEELTKKLLVIRRATVETEKGYELQFSPSDVTVGEVAEWVVAESKCCSFFDFHIDLENAGTLICLRLTGTEGVKQFIRLEFGLK